MMHTAERQAALEHATARQVEQRDTALQRANDIRLARAEIKRQVNRGELDLAALLIDPPEALLTAQVGDVLMYQHGVGWSRVKKILAPGLGSPGCGATTKLGSLGLKTRMRIVDRMELVAPTAFQNAA